MSTTAQRYAQASHGLAGETYDEDEEDIPVGFEQDPEEEDAGVGTWHYADGRTAYSRGDPVMASRLAMPAAPVPTTAQNYARAASNLAGAGEAEKAPAPPPAPPPEPEKPAEPPPAKADEEDDDGFEVISGLPEEDNKQTLEMSADTPNGGKTERLDMRTGDDPGSIQPLSAPGPTPPGAKPVTAPIDIPASSRIAKEHNNPGNLKFAGQQGAVRGEKAADGGYFARFETPEMGTAALRHQVDLDSGRGKTLEQFVSGFAPPASNDTRGYVDRASKALGARPDTPLSAIDPGKVTAFVANQESSTRLAPSAGQPPVAVGPGLARKVSASDQRSESEQTARGANVSVSRSGSAQPFAEFAESQRQLGGAYDESIRQTGLGLAGQSAAFQKTRDELMTQAKDQEVATAAAMAQRDARAKAVATKMQEIGSRPVDINRTWKDRGTLGTMMGLLGVALRSRHATKFGGPNTAMQYLEAERDKDIQAQMGDRDSELRSLERELGSLDAARPMLEARMAEAMAKRVQALMQDEKDATTLANGRQIAGNYMRERETKLGETARAYYGNIARNEAINAQQTGTRTIGSEMSDTVGPEGAGSGSGRLTLRELAEQDQALEEQGWSAEQRAEVWHRNGYDPPTDKTAAQYKREQTDAESEAKRSEAEGKAQAARDALDGFYNGAGLIRDAKTGRWKPNDQGVVPPGFAESINPFDDNEIESAGEAAVEAYGRMQSGGVIGDDEREAFREQVGLTTGNRKRLAARANAIEATLRARLPGETRKTPTSAPASWKATPPEEKR